MLGIDPGTFYTPPCPPSKVQGKAIPCSILSSSRLNLSEPRPSSSQCWWWTWNPGQLSLRMLAGRCWQQAQGNCLMSFVLWLVSEPAFSQRGVGEAVSCQSQHCCGWTLLSDTYRTNLGAFISPTMFYGMYSWVGVHKMQPLYKDICFPWASFYHLVIYNHFSVPPYFLKKIISCSLDYLRVR